MAITKVAVRDAQAIHWLNQIEIDAKRVIAELPTYEDESVLEIRRQSEILGTMAWRVRFAADAEILRRITERSAGQSRDGESQTIAKAIKEHAAAVGVTEQHIRRNARAHRLFTNIYVRENGVELLEEPTYFYLALETPDPEGTLVTFIEAKASNARFSVGDALRWVKEGKTPNLDDTPRPALETEEQKRVYFNWRRASAELMRSIPIWRGYVGGYIEELEYEAGRPSESWRARIIEKLTMGCNTVQLLAREFGLDRIHCQVMLNRLKEDGTLIEEKQARAPGARGAAQIIYSINPRSDEYCGERYQGSKYVMVEGEDDDD